MRSIPIANDKSPPSSKRFFFVKPRVASLKFLRTLCIVDTNDRRKSRTCTDRGVCSFNHPMRMLVAGDDDRRLHQTH